MTDARQNMQLRESDLQCRLCGWWFPQNETCHCCSALGTDVEEPRLEHPKLQEAYKALVNYTEKSKRRNMVQQAKDEQLLWAMFALLGWATEKERTMPIREIDAVSRNTQVVRDMASLLRHALEKNHVLSPCSCSPCEKISELLGIGPVKELLWERWFQAHSPEDRP